MGLTCAYEYVCRPPEATSVKLKEPTGMTQGVILFVISGGWGWGWGCGGRAVMCGSSFCESSRGDTLFPESRGKLYKLVASVRHIPTL